MILVDTSIWIDFINKGRDEHLGDLLAGESVVMHDFVIGEIAMGSLKNRKTQLAFLKDLHSLPTADDSEAMMLVESAKLHGTGLSFIDAHLLAAARASADKEPVRIWTRDSKLADWASELGVGYVPT